MATTTPNFGWTVPTTSDLVKNGATAIALLGQDIDTEFAGLTVNAQTGTTYTAVKADGLYSICTMDNASANTSASQLMQLIISLLAQLCLFIKKVWE